MKRTITGMISEDARVPEANAASVRQDKVIKYL
jgi:hypothetical protein